MQKMPPLEKIHEALSAVADGRIAMHDGQAEVKSSNGAKTYSVKWSGDKYSSNDSATYWQKYAGYPIIAVLFLQGRLKLPSEDVVSKFAGVDWNALNAKYKRNYARAAAEVMEKIGREGIDVDLLDNEIRIIYEQLGQLPLVISR